MDAIDQNKLRQLLSGPQGQQLLRLLSRDGGGALKQAGAAVQQGNAAEAQNILAPLMEDPEVRKLLTAIQDSAGRG